MMKTNMQLISVGFRCHPLRIATLVVALGLGACETTPPELDPRNTGKTARARFDEVDQNHDGKLSRDEASDYLVNKVFDTCDTNRDGRISQSEWTAPDPSNRPEFNKRDANHDGVLTKEEAIAYGRKHGAVNKIMREADKDGDGQLSFDEVKAYYAEREGPVR